MTTEAHPTENLKRMPCIHSETERTNHRAGPPPPLETTIPAKNATWAWMPGGMAVSVGPKLTQWMASSLLLPSRTSCALATMKTTVPSGHTGSPASCMRTETRMESRGSRNPIEDTYMWNGRPAEAIPLERRKMPETMKDEGGGIVLSGEGGSGGSRVTCDSAIIAGIPSAKPWDRRGLACGLPPSTPCHTADLVGNPGPTIAMCFTERRPCAFRCHLTAARATVHDQHGRGLVPYLCGRVWVNVADRRLGSRRAQDRGDPERVVGTRTQHRRSSFFIGLQVLARPSSNAHQPWTAPGLRCESSLAVPLPLAV